MQITLRLKNLALDSSYLRFSDEMLGQLDDGEVAAADGPADLVETHAQQLIRLRLLLRSRGRRQ